MAADELIQIVDSNDDPVGTATRAQAWQDGLIHRIAVVMVEDKDGKILLQKRSSTKTIYPNAWDIAAGGWVDAGESYEVAAKRELAEELGITNLNLIELGHFYADKPYGKYIRKRFIKAYKVKANKTPTNLQTNELSEVKWFNLPEIKDLIREHPDKVMDDLQYVIERYYK